MLRKVFMRTTCKRIVFVLIIIFLLLLRATGSGYIFGYTTLIVLSSSMEPALPVGTLVISKEYDGEEIRTGDIVSYTGTAGEREILVTHRVVSVDEKKGTVCTKGDANTYEDEPVKLTDISGIAVLAFPYTRQAAATAILIYFFMISVRRRKGHYVKERD